MRNVRNIEASLHRRLLNIAKKENKDFTMVFRQYAQERLLYRLSISKYKSNFILKGALMMLIYEPLRYRPTKDMDFLSKKIPENDIFKALGEIGSHRLDDGLKFDENKMSSVGIKKEDNYHGVSVSMPVSMGTIRTVLNIDVGFGDVVYPSPKLFSFPVLLEGEAPNVYVYPVETAIAEKFETMMHRGASSSRVKDVYDIVFYASHYPMDSEKLLKAIKGTFKSRGQSYQGWPDVRESLKNAADKEYQWASFLKKTNIKGVCGFSQLIDEIGDFLEPLINEEAKGKWVPEKWIWTDE